MRDLTELPQEFSTRAELQDVLLQGDCLDLLPKLPADLVNLSFWSPPYFVGKKYEEHLSFEHWKALISGAMFAHGQIMAEGGFVVVNINDILCFPDPDMPRFMANNVTNKKVKISREQILAMKTKYPDANRHELAKLMGCSEQTIQRRLEHNNVRGGKQAVATKVYSVSSLLIEAAEQAGLYLYDRKIWHKDPAWANSRWHSNSYRGVDEFEYLYVFWRPGMIDIDRDKIARNEWSEWGSRAVWKIGSVQRNDRHECEFPEELAERVIRLFSKPGDLVLDPFCGAGTTLAMAKKHNRKYLGIERLGEYVELSKDRISATQPHYD